MSENSTAESNPFAAFEQASGAGSVLDPYPKFLDLMAETPIWEGRLDRIFDVPQLAMMFRDDQRYFVALSYDAVSEVLLDGETFSSKGYADTMGLVMGHSILEMDEPEHRSYRNLLKHAFTLKAMERWERDIVRPIVDEHIDRFAARGSAELVAELTLPFPIHVIAGMMGLPEEDLPEFHRRAIELISITIDIERGFAASQSLRDYFAAVLAARRAAPCDDLISMLAGAELDGQRLSDEEIFAFLRLLLPAGAETTYRSSSNLLCGLLNDPRQLNALRDDRGLMKQAIEEGLRWEPPLTTIMRTATRDTEVCGVAVPAGAQITVCMAAANRDPSRYERPHELDILREQKSHLAFATGPHTCLGLHLARMETTVLLNALFDRLPNLRLAPDAGEVSITGLTFRAPSRLPVVFDN